MKTWGVFLALLLLCIPACPTTASGSGSKTVAVPILEPSKTQVGVLPFVDESGRRNKESAKWCADGFDTCRAEFLRRGFQVLPCDTVTKVLTDRKLDLSDDESRTRERLKTAGQAMSADILVMAVLRPLRKGAGIRKWYRSTVEMRIMNVADGTYFVDGAFEASKGGSNLSSIPFIPLFVIVDQTNRSTPLREGAVSRAVRECLKDFLAPYKVIPEMDKQGPAPPPKTNEDAGTQSR